MAFGFSPKYSEEFYFGEFSSSQFLALVVEVARKLEWDVQFISENGFIVYLNKGTFKWNAEITLRLNDNNAVLTSMSLGSEMFDWGKNKKIVEEFMDMLVDLKYKLKPAELDSRYEELKARFNPPEEDFLDPDAQPEGFFKSLFWPKKGYAVTPVLIVVNTLIFLLMVFAGVHFLEPDSESLIKWGANFRPITQSGEWWRLLTSCFIHIGILHLFLNMYALLYIGILLEPRIGSAKFAFAYLISGLTGSVASFWWHDITISAGASGAIFGMYGVFLALLTTNLIDRNARKDLLVSITVFVGYNLLSGLKGGIDNAAHIGGLIGGLIVGFSFYSSLYKPEFKVKNSVIIAISGLFILVFSVFLIQSTSDSATKFNQMVQTFSGLEERALGIYRLPKNSPDDVYMKEIQNEGIPNWEKCLELLDKMDSIADLPLQFKERTLLMRKYCKYRIISYELIAESIRGGTDVFNNQIDVYVKKIELIIDKLNDKVVADHLLEVVPLKEFAKNVPSDILYVIDGVPVPDKMKIDQKEIFSVIVIEPERAFSIYGEPGKKGAVLIQTSKFYKERRQKMVQNGKYYLK